MRPNPRSLDKKSLLEWALAQADDNAAGISEAAKAKKPRVRSVSMQTGPGADGLLCEDCPPTGAAWFGPAFGFPNLNLDVVPIY